MEPRTKIWVEAGGKLMLSSYRVQLLRLIAEKGSLAEAAKAMGLSYRRAWGKVKEIEANLGVPLLESAAGGAGGGGSQLTPAARAMVTRYEEFLRAAEGAVRDEFRRAFPDEDQLERGHTQSAKT